VPLLHVLLQASSWLALARADAANLGRTVNKLLQQEERAQLDCRAVPKRR
jgi:hypothetical protein